MVSWIAWQNLLAIDLRARVPLLSAELNVRYTQVWGWVGAVGFGSLELPCQEVH